MKLEEGSEATLWVEPENPAKLTARWINNPTITATNVDGNVATNTWSNKDLTITKKPPL
jgi:hypothetical protein